MLMTLDVYYSHNYIHRLRARAKFILCSDFIFSCTVIQ